MKRSADADEEIETHIIKQMKVDEDEVPEGIVHEEDAETQEYVISTIILHLNMSVQCKSVNNILI
jgi:hypothetical protein